MDNQKTDNQTNNKPPLAKRLTNGLFLIITRIISMLVPLIGFILSISLKKTSPKLSKDYLICGIVGLVSWIILPIVW